MKKILQYGGMIVLVVLVVVMGRFVLKERKPYDLEKIQKNSSRRLRLSNESIILHRRRNRI